MDNRIVFRAEPLLFPDGTTEAFSGCRLTVERPIRNTMRAMSRRAVALLFSISTAFLLSSCANVQHGVIVEKRSRAGMSNVYATWSPLERPEPDVFWVTVEGRTKSGRVARKDIILFRHDWEQLRIRDVWDRESGFAPAEAFAK